MPKLTRELIQKINGKCSNDWKLDIEYFLFHNEKQLYKRIELDTENYLQFDLGYNGRNEKSLHIAKYHHEADDYFAVSEGLGKFVKLSQSENRKSINSLIELTEQLTDERLMQINNETEVYKSPVFVASQEF